MTSSVFAHVLGRSANLDRLAVLGPQPATYGELLARAERIARRLQQHAAAAGSAVALDLPHGLDQIASLLAIRRTGAVAVPLNPRATPFEKAHVLKDAGCRLLLGSETTEVAVDDVAARLVDGVDGIALLGLPAPKQSELLSSDSVVIYTSGSTNRPKGVVLSEAAFSANVEAVADYLALAEGDRCALFTPPSFAYALSQIMTHLYAGGALLPAPGGMLEPEKLLQDLAANGITGIQANPSIFEIMTGLELEQWPDLSAVRYVMSSGQNLMSPLAQKLTGRFPNARIVSMYGCTENAPRITYSWLPAVVPDRAMPWPVGKPIAGTRLRIVDETGADAACGQVGEIWISGTSLMRTYLTIGRGFVAETEDGAVWYNTRDLGFLDGDGELNLIGRSDNVFSVGHEKVSPEEIEEVAGAVPGVLEVAVVPVPHPILAHVPALIYVAESESVPDRAQDIRAECARRLSRAKFPRFIARVGSIPRTAYGKVDRRRLHALVLNVFKVAANAP